MFLPETYQAALFLMILSMLCWGSWANTLKLCPRFRFQLFYWDYAIGLAAGAVLWGLTAGSMGHAGLPFFNAIANTPLDAIVWAACGGVVFNVANLLLVAAIDVAGLAVAFPVGIGLALVVGSVSSYFFKPAGNPLLLFAGIALVTVAIVLDAAAYRKRGTETKATTTRGIVLSLVAGLLMGCWYPIATHDLATATGPGPYSIALFFAIGVLISTVPANLLLMARPLDGKPPVNGADYWTRTDRLASRRHPGRSHLVRRGGVELCRFGRTPRPAHRARRFLLHWPGRHHDLGMLGRICVARVCRRASLGQDAAVSHVCVFPAGAWIDRPGSALLARPSTMADRKPVVVVGSINMDLVARTPRIALAGETLTGTGFDTTPGGKGANQAVAAARLGYPVAMVGMVGDDVFGQALLDNLGHAGVDTGAVARVSGPSGVAQIQVAADGQNSIIVVPGANGQVEPAYIYQHERLIRSAGMVLCQLELPIETVADTLELCAAANVPVMLDPAPAATLPESSGRRSRGSLRTRPKQRFTSTKISRVEETAKHLLAKGVKGVVLKRGAREPTSMPPEAKPHGCLHSR